MGHKKNMQRARTTGATIGACIGGNIGATTSASYCLSAQGVPPLKAAMIGAGCGITTGFTYGVGTLLCCLGINAVQNRNRKRAAAERTVIETEATPNYETITTPPEQPVFKR